MNIFDAASEGNIKWLEDNNDYKVNEKNQYGNTALMLAAAKGHKEIVGALLEKDANVNAANQYGNTALIWAAENGHVATVSALLEKGANVNTKNQYGDTALIWAAKNGHLEIVRALLEKGAEVNAKNNNGSTALMWAAWNGHEKIAEQLNTVIEANEHLIKAGKSGNLYDARKALQNGANVNTQDTKGYTALIWAAREGHIEIVRALLEKDSIEVNTKNQYGNTALIWAAMNGYKEIVELLLQNGATYKLGFFDWFYYNQSIYHQLKQATPPDILWNYSTIQALIASTLMTAVFIVLLMLTETPSVALISSLWVLLSASATCYIMQSRGYDFHVYAKDSAKAVEAIAVVEAIGVEAYTRSVVEPSAPPIELQEENAEENATVSNYHKTGK